MITRLQISGFKNLVDVDVRFGPFTCVAGANGVGKSNLFDAIRFLSALADQPLMEAAKSVRDGQTADIRSLFHRVGGSYDECMSFTIEMLVPPAGEDDLGQPATATMTFLRYKLDLGWRPDKGQFAVGGLEVLREGLEHITQKEASRHLLFPHSMEWRRSVVSGQRKAPFISTVKGDSGKMVVMLHLDRGREAGSAGGRPAARLAETLRRTVLSVANAAENKTAALARLELRSWRLLQLEPSALRESDIFAAPTHLDSDGSHLPATIYRLARTLEQGESVPDESRLYSRLTNRLKDLIDDVRGVSIDRDEKRERLTLLSEGNDGTKHTARALSDGTLRFLALAAIELDSTGQGVLCFEEPENGIHPARIPAMIRLLQDIAVDTELPVGPDNPLQQVIINTHSPAVASQVDDDALVIAVRHEIVQKGNPCQVVRFGSLKHTWRTEKGHTEPIAKGLLLSYLHPNVPLNIEDMARQSQGRKSRRVMDRPDFEPSLFDAIK